EGTTTPVSFVYDALFPYARKRLRAYLHEHSAANADAIRLLRDEWSSDVAAGEPVIDLVPRGAVQHGDASAWALYLVWLMGRDRKSPALKLVQGRIWQGGFASGALCGQLYPDVRPALERWRAAGLSTAIYSSGSVLAQRLVFAHSTDGDLSFLIDCHFDTDVGPKRSPESYRRIASAMGRAAETMLFISDVVEELDAARLSGIRTLLCVRDGAADPQGDEPRFPVIRSFDELSG
ncbi:MAG TPA: acireductone synthase, partial [Gemmatimonadaceae bacterium]|nr:acireductone synthase [Gemmatimonadaceae bacterium]